MDKVMILERLERARAHVETGERLVRRQREIIADLERDGHQIRLAAQILRQLEHLQRLHLADRDRLEERLAHAERGDPPIPEPRLLRGRR